MHLQHQLNHQFPIYCVVMLVCASLAVMYRRERPRLEMWFYVCGALINLLLAIGNILVAADIGRRYFKLVGVAELTVFAMAVVIFIRLRKYKRDQ